MPVPDGWHEDYAMGKVTTDDFLKVKGMRYNGEK
jgi:hypothetical protein